MVIATININIVTQNGVGFVSIFGRTSGRWFRGQGSSTILLLNFTQPKRSFEISDSGAKVLKKWGEKLGCQK